MAKSFRTKVDTEASLVLHFHRRLLRQPTNEEIMGPLTITIAAIVALFSFGCTPATATYPSYERTMAKYAPPGEVEGSPAEGAPCDGMGDGCDCPRFWHHDRWVYRCGDQFVYWHYGYWYYYPHPHFYYFHEPSTNPGAKRRRITKE